MMKIQSLRQEIEQRREQRDGIRRKINCYCQAQFGIPDLYEIVDRFFGPQQEALRVCIARQVPSISIETVAFELLCQWLTLCDFPVTPHVLGLKRDSFVQSRYKQALANMQVVFQGKYAAARTQWPVTETTRLRDLSGRIFHYIRTASVADLLSFFDRTAIVGKKPREMMRDELQRHLNGHDQKHRSLSLFHKALRNMVFGRDGASILDASETFEEFLRSSLAAYPNGNYPSYFFHDDNGHDAIFYLNGGGVPDDIHKKSLRPPAEWYYLFYMMMFLDGTAALVRTVGHDNDECCEWFTKAAQNIKSVCGFEPLFIDVPDQVEVNGYQSNLFEVGFRLLIPWNAEQGKNSTGWHSRISMPSVAATCYDSFRSFAEQAIVLS